MKHKRFEENILVDEAYTNYGKIDKNADEKKGQGIAKHFAETLEYEEKEKWFTRLPTETSSTNELSREKIEELRKEASSALHGDTLAYETKSNRNGSSDHQWARTLLNKGGIGDRVAAATILIQDNPIHNMTALRNLINSVKPAKKKDGIVIIDALSELLVAELLIPNVKLRTFEQHSLANIDEMTSGNKQMRRNILKLWYYEDQLKELYGTYVDALNKFAHDSVDANKEKAVSAMSYLLMHHPEREKMLLSNIINKLGDPTQAVASKVIYHLCQLLYNHPNMKSVVLADIEKMLFRSNISPRAQYYGVCFLNQFYLGKDDSNIAEDLIRIYFSFFKASIKKGEIDSRLMSAILTGVKRAYPFANKERLSETPAHIDAIHRLVHLAKLNVAIHALALLYHVSAASKHTSDRFYSALYRKLTNAEIFNTTHSALLFSLIYKSLKQDKDANRVSSFIKRLLQLSLYMSPAQACGILLLISQVLKDGDKKEAINLVWTQRELKQEIKDETEQKEAPETHEKTTDIDNTQSTVCEEDNSSQEEDVEKDVNAEVKKMDLLRGDKKDLLIDDDEEESYVDLKIDDKGNVKPKKRKRNSTAAGWFHAKVKSENTEDIKEANEEVLKSKEVETKIQLKKTINMDKIISEYNPFARNPSFAGAHCSAYTELLPLSKHYHPTVKLFAEKIINAVDCKKTGIHIFPKDIKRRKQWINYHMRNSYTDQLIQYSGDPLKDFAGIRFLDRFVFKNPKKRVENQDGDVKKVKGSHPKFAIRKNYSAKGVKGLPVTSESYLNEDVKKIPVDEKFLYDFLQKRRSTQQAEDEDDSDNDSVTSDDFDKYLDSITGTTAKDESDEELDYLAEIATNKQQKRSKKGDTSDDEIGNDDDDDLQSDNDDSNGELNISADEDEPVLSTDEDEMLLEVSDDDGDQIDVPNKSKNNKIKLKLKGKDDLGSLFASAEEFSTILEDTATNKKQGSSQAVSNTDNASNKQLAWEDRRDRWIKGYNKKIHGYKGKSKRSNKTSSVKNDNKMSQDKKRGGKRKGDSSNGVGGKKKKFK